MNFTLYIYAFYSIFIHKEQHLNTQDNQHFLQRSNKGQLLTLKHSQNYVLFFI